MARPFLQTCTVPLIIYIEGLIHVLTQGRRMRPCLLGREQKEILTISLLTARSAAASTKLPEWHWGMSLHFHCRNTQVENYPVWFRSKPAGILLTRPSLGKITKPHRNLHASPLPISLGMERDHHHISCHHDLWGPRSWQGQKALLRIWFLSLAKIRGKVNTDQ